MIHLGKVQLQIMQVLWNKGEATAREITDAMNVHEPIAHSTVQTLLRGLEDKQAVAYRVEGRVFIFYPLIKEDKVRTSAARDLVQRIFGGNAADLMTHLLKHEKVSPAELDELRKLIESQAKSSCKSNKKNRQ